MTTYQFLTTAWRWNYIPLLFCSLVLAGYFLAFRRRGHPAYLGGALVVFLVALISPLSALADGYLFSAHMVQHILLVLVVPAFLLLSLPRSFSLPRSLTVLTHPFIGWLAGVGAMWL
jgi:putative membrane protein